MGSRLRNTCSWSWQHLTACRRALCTDHGAFVVINVYCPNAGSPPERARLPIKMRFLEALKRKADELAALGREVCQLRVAT